MQKTAKYDRGRVVLKLSDPAVSIDHVNMVDKKGYFEMFDLGNGVVEVGFKTDTALPAVIKELKSSTVQLQVFLKGNGTGVKNASVNVTVNLK